MQHSGDNPVTSIKMYQCPGNEICDMMDNSFAWITSQKQMYSASNHDKEQPSNSQIYFKDTKYYCKNAGQFSIGLNAGQPCSKDRDCASGSCNSNNYCYGNPSGYGCSSHVDCDVKLSCIPSASFPYLSTCQSWKTSGTCRDDYDCDPRYYCWYASASDVSIPTLTCLAKYTQPDGTLFGWKDVNSNIFDRMV